jgi:hypothetical protein
VRHLFIHAFDYPDISLEQNTSPFEVSFCATRNKAITVELLLLLVTPGYLMPECMLMFSGMPWGSISGYQTIKSYKEMIK